MKIQIFMLLGPGRPLVGGTMYARSLEGETLGRVLTLCFAPLALSSVLESDHPKCRRPFPCACGIRGAF